MHSILSFSDLQIVLGRSRQVQPFDSWIERFKKIFFTTSNPPWEDFWAYADSNTPLANPNYNTIRSQ